MPATATPFGRSPYIAGRRDGRLRRPDDRVSRRWDEPRGALTLADVDADGKLDAIVESAWSPGSSGSASGTVTVVLGDGTGEFGASASYGLGNTAGEISVAGDGDKDMAVARYGADVALLLSDGSGGFGVNSTSTGNGSTADVVLDDLDGDSDLDVASGNPFGPQDEVTEEYCMGRVVAATTRPVPRSQKVSAGGKREA